MAEKHQKGSIIFRPASKGDAAFILNVEKTTMRGYAEALWGKWRRSSTVEELDHSGHYIIEIDSVSVGCLALNENADSLRIKKLYLEPKYQKQGVGAESLAWVSQIAENKGLDITLSVLQTNPARRFYLREGFSITSETQERFQMRKKIP